MRGRGFCCSLRAACAALGWWSLPAAATTVVAAVAAVMPRSEPGSTKGAKKIDLSLDGQREGQRHATAPARTRPATSKDWVKKFNSQNNGVTVELRRVPAVTPAEQRNQFVQRQQAKSGDCDIF